MYQHTDVTVLYIPCTFDRIYHQEVEENKMFLGEVCLNFKSTGVKER